MQQLLAASGLDVPCSPITTSSQGTPDHERTGLEEVELQVESLVLARLLSCVGNVAQQQLVHLEVTVSKELKRQRQDEQERKSSRKRGDNHKKVRLQSQILSLYLPS